MHRRRLGLDEDRVLVRALASTGVKAWLNIIAATAESDRARTVKARITGSFPLHFISVLSVISAPSSGWRRRSELR